MVWAMIVGGKSRLYRRIPERFAGEILRMSQIRDQADNRRFDWVMDGARQVRSTEETGPCGMFLHQPNRVASESSLCAGGQAPSPIFFKTAVTLGSSLMLATRGSRASTGSQFARVSYSFSISSIALSISPNPT